ncbi:MAG: putative toxin-antitoxin system toxin component, PIN family [Gammaproteobacteria bacterium]|nr:putative toxin-antitoxin system toxin component, PIN family [Gammaproteobacteria bacterium]
MARKIVIVDTNVIVSGLIGSDPNSPPARILDAMLEGDFPYVMSTALFNEYSSVLRRPAVVRQHGLTEPEVVLLLTNLTENAIWHDPVISNMAPDFGDNHIWALLESQPHALLITGDKLLIGNPPTGAIVISPRNVIEMILA